MGKFRYAALAFLPFALLCVFLISTTSDLPVSDQWSLIPLLGKWHAGSLTLGDLLGQYVEHRPFFPRLILLSVAAATHWNLYYEVAANLFFGVLICAILFYQIRKMEVFFGTRSGAVYFLTAVFVFSVAQSNNWFCAQVSPFLCILSFIAGALFLSSPGLSPANFLLAAAAGFVATYSHANGLLFWGIGFLLLCAHPLRSGKAVCAAWFAVSCVAAASYFWTYLQPGQHPSPLFAVQHPFQTAAYFLVFIGNPLLPFERFAPLVGVFGLFCLSALVFAAYHSYQAVKKDPPALLLLFPWYALAFFSAASGALAAFGRVGFGIAQATASRYATQSGLLWISLIVLTPVAARSFMREGPGLLPALLRNRALKTACAVMFFALLAVMTKQKWHWEKVSRDELTVVRNSLLAGEYKDELINPRIYPGDLRDKLEILKKYRLAFFRGEDAVPAAPPPGK